MKKQNTQHDIEVIRCKNCIHYEPYTNEMGYCKYWCENKHPKLGCFDGIEKDENPSKKGKK